MMYDGEGGVPNFFCKTSGRWRRTLHFSPNSVAISQRLPASPIIWDAPDGEQHSDITSLF